MKLPARWKEMSPVFDELLDLDAAAQAGRLDDLRTRDPELAAALQALLESAAQATRREFLEHRPPLDDDGAGMLGRRIGPYVIEAELGRGGSGSVWKARRADGQFEGVVAIKLLHRSLLGRSERRRFHREGAILSRLTHPDIARLLDAGVAPDGQPYLVLELVDGRPIDRHCDERRLDVPARLALLHDVACCVSHAHTHLVVHRDLKPSNILVSPDGRIKLLDFGIAKLLGDERDDATLTADSQRMLTPRYAAPEQLAGEPVTTATDVYALGVLMYRLLAGRFPTSVDGASPSEIATGTLATEPARLGASFERARPAGGVDPQELADRRRTSVKALRRQLRGDLDAIVSRALRKTPSERYASAAAFATDLERHLGGLPVAARSGTTRYRLGKLVRRHKGATLASALLAMAVVTGLAGTVSQARRAEHQRDLALHQLKGAESTRAFTHFLLSEGTDRAPLAPALLERGERLVDQEFARDPEERARLQLLLGRLYGEAYVQGKAEALLRQAQANARQVDDADLKVQVDCELGWQLGSNGQPARAAALLDTAIAALRAGESIDPSTLARCLSARSEVLYRQDDLRGALAAVREALAVVGEPRPDQRVDVIGMRARLATIEGKLGDSAAAAGQLRQALDDMAAIGRAETQYAVAIHHNLGVLLNSAGRPREAAAEFTRAVAIARQVGHPEPITLGNLARVLIDLGRPREAIELTQDALKSLADAADQGLAPTMKGYGAPAWCAIGDLAQCRALIDQAQRAFAVRPPSDKSVVPVVRLRAAMLAAQEGDLAAARAQARQAVDELDALQNRNAIKARALLARLDLQAGDTAQAALHAEQAVQAAQARRGGFAHTAWLGSALLSRGMARRAQGDRAAALQDLRSALAELRDAAGDDAPETVAARDALAPLAL